MGVSKSNRRLKGNQSMATRMNSFTKTGVALASAAAVVAATPALAPSISVPTPPALSKAAYELTDFATFFQFLTDPEELQYAYFSGWGGAIGPINVDPQEPVEADYWLPNCNYDCSIAGLSGVGYMLLDALINGDQGSNEWPTSAVNYFFEGSLGIGLQYIVQQPFAPGAPLENEQIFDAIALAWQGLYAFTTFYYAGLTAVADLLSAVPLVGPLTGGAIYAYLYGYNVGTVEFPAFSAPGLTGVLAYVLGTLRGGFLPQAAAATPAAAAVAAPVLRTSVETPKAVETAPEPVAETVSAPAVAEPAVEDSAPAVVTPVAEEAAPVAEETASEAGTVSEAAPESVVDAPEETTPVAPVETPADVADEVPVSAPAEPKPVKAPKRPIRSAVERVTKSVQSALGGGAKAEASDAGSASGDTGSADSAE